MSGSPVTPEQVEAVIGALGRKPATKRWLSVRTGIPERGIEAVVEHVRRESLFLVASGGEGYWLPGSLEEAESNVERRHRRAIRQMETLSGERRLIRRMRDAEGATPSLWSVA